MQGREFIFLEGDKKILFKTDCYFKFTDLQYIKQMYPRFEDFRKNLESRGYQVEIVDSVKPKSRTL